MTWTHLDLSRAVRRRPPLFLQGPVADFALAALAGAGLVLALGAALGAGGAASLAAGLAVYGAGALAAGRLMRRTYPHASVGHCNLVTLLRLALSAALIPPLVSGVGAHWGLFAVAVLALSLDGVDGWLARRQGFVSGFGARFDMEVDSLLALVLAVGAWSAGGAPFAVVLLGLPRYAFGAAGVILPWLRAPLPERFSRKTVCVIQLGALIVLQLPLLPGWASAGLVAVAGGALAWSFARDVAWLRRNRD
ncbi:CDP-alcohol phosphatidyltransferase family protein [Roseicyclus sp.]|uniref:CDP-alcohol phosphatidyltransferase family protein n=1 Tax=Roseicyclus sp. TaxID=1914329 RepID=UPI003FA110B8